MGQKCSVCLEKRFPVYKCCVLLCKKCALRLSLNCPVCQRDQLSAENMCQVCKTLQIHMRPCMKCCTWCHCMCKKKKHWIDAITI